MLHVRHRTRVWIASRSLPRVTGCTAALLLGLATAIQAQEARGTGGAEISVASASQYTPLRNVARAPLLEQPVTLAVSRASMADALDEVARVSGVRVLYGEDVLASRKRVTLQFSGTTLGDALAEVLRDSELEALLARDGRAVLVKKRAVVERRVVGIVRGRVIDAETRQPLAAVQVAVPGTTRGTTTNDDGVYTLGNVPAGALTLRAVRIGYSPSQQSVIVLDNGTVTLDFALRQSAVSLDQVVVTATGEERSRAIATSIPTISADQFRDAPVVNAQDALVGRVAGVSVIANGGAPGSGGTIRLRGVNSISQGNNPILVVDGVRMYNDLVPAGWGGRQGYLPMNDISAQDIDRIEIVRGAAATTLYGTEASGGVIQIFTKRGSSSRPVWDMTATGGFNNIGHIGSDDDPTGLFVNKCRGPELVNSLGEPFVDVTCPASGTYLKTGALQRYALSVRGGSERMSYFASGNYGDVNGVLPTSWNRDGGFRANFAFFPTENLQLSVNTAYTKRKTRWAADGDNSEGLMLNASRGDAGYFVDAAACADYTGTANCIANGYVFDDQLYTNVDHFVGGLTANYNLSDRLTNRFTVGYDFNSNIHDTGIPWGYPTYPLGYLWNENRRHTKLSLDYVGSWRADFAPSLASTLSWGGQLFRDSDRWTEIDVSNFAGPGVPTLGSGGVTEVYADEILNVVNAGFFVQEMVGWQDRVFLTAGLRVDGNSSFGDNFGAQAYPKVGASYVISTHDFWPQWWETMKLRAALGESGKAPGAFDAVRTWSTVPSDSGRPGFTPNVLGNADLGPERTREIEFGFDAGLLNGRLGLEVTAFRARTYDALIGIAAPPSLGFTSAQLRNAGTLQNSGLETQVTVGLLRNANLDWTARTSYSAINGKALDLRGEEISTFFGTEAREGFALPTYFGSRVTNPNEIADPILEDDVSLGRQYANRIVGLGTTITFRNSLTLDVVGEGQYGGHLVNYTAYQNARRGVWYPCYETQRAMRAAAGGDAAAMNGITALQRARCNIVRGETSADFWTEKTDFFKLRSVALTYALPRQWIGSASAASISVSGRNLLTWTKYSGVDPEVQDVADAGINALGRRDYYNFPNYRTFELTARLTY